MEPMTWQDVQATLDRFGLGLRVQLSQTSTATSQQAADTLGCELGQIAKSLCFMVDGQPVLVIASGDRRVDEKKLADLHGVARKRIKIASAEECVAIFGYPPGSVPPVGLRTPNLPVYIEDSLARYTDIFAAAGAPNAIFPLTYAQLLHITGGTVVDLKREG